MNDAWQWCPIGELFEIGAGKTMSAAARGADAKVPFLRTSNVFWDRIDLTTLDEMFIPPHELERKLLEPGDLLVCEGGAIGRAAIWDGAAATMSFQNHLHRLRPKVEELEPRFYVFFLQCAFTQLGIFAGAGNKTTIPNLSSSRLSALEVPKPSLAVQQAIVKALGCLRDAQRLHGELLAGTNELKRAVMEMVFRAGLHGSPQVDSSIGLVPEDWVVESLGESHTVQTGGTPRRNNASYWDDGAIPWVKTAEVAYATIVETSEHITERALAETSIKLFDPGTLLLAMYGQGVTRGKVAKLGIAATCNQACAAIQSRAGVVDPDYLQLYLEWNYEYIRSRAHGGQQQNLNLDIVRQLPVAYPPAIEEQRAIASLLNSIDAKLRLHRDRVTVVQELYQRLLHDLMTGEIRADQLTLATELVGVAV